MCNKTFETKQNLKEHIEKKHGMKRTENVIDESIVNPPAAMAIEHQAEDTIEHGYSESTKKVSETDRSKLCWYCPRSVNWPAMHAV